MVGRVRTMKVVAMPQAIAYERTPSAELRDLLAPGGFLSPVCDLHRDGELDVHFRGGDIIHAYCGLTRLFDLERKRRGGTLTVSADRKHMQYDLERAFFGDWKPHSDGFKEAMDNYLGRVKVGSRHTSKEGAVQMKWSRVTEPWIPFDREVRLKYRSEEHRQKAKKFDAVKEAYRELYERADRGGWAKPTKTASKLDQLAVSPDGRLVLVELKDAEKGQSKEIFYSPFQLLQYVWEWHGALENNASLLKQVQSLLDVRVELGLTAPATTIAGCIRAAVCFGRDGRSDKVKRRYCRVLQICNSHLPDGVAPIETWEYGGERPHLCPYPASTTRTSL